MPEFRIARRGLTAVAIAVLVSGTTPAPSRAATEPGVPTELVAAAGDGFAILRWNVPDDGGSPITSYVLLNYTGGVNYYAGEIFPTSNTTTLGESQFVLNTLPVEFSLRACNAVDCSGDSVRSNEVTPWEGALAPQLEYAAIEPAGGTVSTDTGDVEPSAANPVITSVTVPATLAGGSLSIAETTLPYEGPTGYTFLGQQIVIESTAATEPSNPLSITFRVDPAQVPVTIFRDGAPITDTCTTPGIAVPSPCIASGAGTAAITILADHASTWNVGIVNYGFGGFASPVDNLPISNVAKAGRAVPVRFGLGGDMGLNIFSTPPSSQRIDCETTAGLDTIEETLPTTSPLSYSPGTNQYQLGWNTERSWAGTCRELDLRFRDGSVARAWFAFR